MSATAATVNAEVDPEGSATSCRFEYIAEGPGFQAHGFENALISPSGAPIGIGAGTSPLSVSQHLTNLQPATRYHYRVSTTNGSGTTLGPEKTFTTQESAVAYSLPDGRGWEMVSPVDKNGGEIQQPETIFGGGAFQAAAQGGAATYSSTSSFGEAPAGAPPASQYVSTRSASGWLTQNITAVGVSGAYGSRPDGVPYRLFGEDLARGLMLNGQRCSASEPCPRSYSLWQGAIAEIPGTGGLRFEGASPDLRHIVFATEGGLYEWSGAGLVTISATPGAALAAPVGAISEDGSRIYFSAEGDLYLREGSSTHQADEAQGGGGAFQAATPSGDIAFFTKQGHLYRYLASTHAAADLTPGGGVMGVLGISADGSTAYLQDEAGLERWREGATMLLVASAGAAQLSDFPPAAGTARVSADGSVLLFLSQQPLTGYDNTDQTSDEPDSEVFLWRGGSLTCVSCNPTGERPAGPSTVPSAVANGSTRAYRPRALALSGGRVFFDSADTLTPNDGDGRPDVYEWEAEGEGSCQQQGGCLALVSGGRGGEARFVDASADGNDVFFLTDASLVGADPGSFDLYDARVGGGFPEPAAPIECVGDACQPLPEAPEDPTVGTTIPGPGNPPLSYPKPHCPKGKHRVRGHGKSRCVKKARGGGKAGGSR